MQEQAIIPFLWKAEVLTHRSMVSFIRRVSRNFSWTSVPTDPLRNTATCVEKECLATVVYLHSPCMLPKKTMNNHPCQIYPENVWLCRRESPISRYRETSENIKMRDWHLLEGWRRYIIVSNCDDLVPYFYRTRLFSSAPRHKRLDLDKRKKMIPWETCWSK